MPHNDRYGYIVIRSEELKHFSRCRRDILDVFLVKYIDQMLQVHTMTAVSSDHNPIILQMVDWRKHTSQNSHRRP